ncbi:MAG: ABC transporter substrate-binding protein [Actinobacteria bacterium]|nr:ABC transporter substrate-binding protein [Actinomycetota bacterium]
MTNRRSTWRVLLLGLSAILTAGLVAACGGSGGSDSTSGGDQTGGKASEETFTGKPIIIGTSVPLESQIQSVPEIPAAIEAAARAINAEGGIAGREVKVEVCDNKAEPNAEVACARSLREKGTVALISEVSILNPAGVLAELAKGDVASLASIPFSTAGYSSPMSFPIDFVSGEYAQCVNPALLKAAGKEKVGAALTDVPAGREFANVLKPTAAKLGSDLAGEVLVPPTATDFAPYVQGLDNLGTEFVVLGLVPTAALGTMSAAVQAGKSWGYCAADGNLAVESVIKLGPSAEGLYQGATMPSLAEASKYPLMEEFVEQLEAEAAAGNDAASMDPEKYSSRSLRAWLGVHAFQQVAESINGEIDAKSFFAALNKATVEFEGVVPTIDFAKSVGKAPFTRIFNAETFAQAWNVDKRQFEEVPGSKLNALEAMGFLK